MKKLYFFAALLMCTFISFGQGLETFDFLADDGQPSSSYLSRSFLGQDGSTWTATNARRDQTIDGVAITLNDDTAGTYVQSGLLTGGIGDLTISTQRKYSGGAGEVDVYVNNTIVGTVPYDETIQTTTIYGINVAEDFVIKLGDASLGDRVAFDNITWSGYGAVSTCSFSNLVATPTCNGTATSIVVTYDSVESETQQFVLYDGGLNAVTEGTISSGGEIVIDGPVNTSDYLIEISDSANPECKIDAIFNITACPVSCSIDNISAIATCTGFETQVVLDYEAISSDAQVYSILDADSNFIAQRVPVPADRTLIFDGSMSEDLYIIEIGDAEDLNCSSIAEFVVEPCAPTGACEGLINETAASTPAGWVVDSQRTSYWLLGNEGGGTDHTVTTSLIDVTGVNTLKATMEVATFGSGTANPAIIEYSIDGGLSFMETGVTNTPSSSSYIDGGEIFFDVADATEIMIRLRSFQPSGRGVRVRNFNVCGEQEAPMLFNSTEDTCVSGTPVVVFGMEYVNIMANGNVIAAINPMGNDLGEVTSSLFNSSAVRTESDAPFMARTIYLTPTTQPNEGANSTITAKPKVKYYFTASEYEQFVAHTTTTVDDGDDVGVESDVQILKVANTVANCGTIVATDGDDREILTAAFGTDSIGRYFEVEVESFSSFTAGTNLTSLLPVELTNFTAEEVNGEVVLNWATATETNNKQFNVLRSANGTNFNQIATVKGNGTTTTAKAYTTVDALPLEGVNYYQLEQVDFDGTTELSQIATVLVKGRNFTVLAANNNAIVVTAQNGGIAKANIYTAQGQLVDTVNFTVEKGTQNVALNTGLVTGVYVIEFTLNGQTTTAKFAVR